ncbi:MAG: peptide ABC transporter substrate-binding protein [Chlamydiales bacterium]|nr:peptide ABC transporter substrate-binding protein [Chlamydiales bacterium]
MLKPRDLVLFVIVALSFSSCQPSPKQQNRQALRINLAEDPQTLDPRAARNLNDWAVMRMFFEGLTRIDKEEKPALALASKIEVSEDLKTYTFHLRPSRWSNGDPVTAEDFAYTWKKILDPQFPADYAFQLYVLKNGKAAKQGAVSLDEIGIEVVDPLKLKIELEQPTPYLLQLLASPCFYPVNKRVDQTDPTWMQKAETYVSNGPFLLTELKHRDLIKVRKNEKYWDKDAVSLNEIEIVMVREETELKMFEKEELDWAGSPLSTLPVDALKELKNEKILQTKPILGTHFLRANVDRPPFNHPWIRWAFALAVDRQSIIEHVMQGNQIPATGLVPVALNLQKEPYFQDADGKMALSLFDASLKELGIERKKFPEITLTYVQSERNHLLAQALQQQWFEALGVRVKLEAVERKIYFDRISKQDYQLCSGSWIADFNDPINFLEIFKYKKASTNNTQWESPQFAQLLDTSSKLLDPEQRHEVLSQSERILVDEMPMIPIFHSTLLYLKNKNLQGVVLTSMGHIDFKWAYFEEQK